MTPDKTASGASPGQRPLAAIVHAPPTTTVALDPAKARDDEDASAT